MKNSLLVTRHQTLSIFVHRASECLTDYESHGDGLICYSLLNGLAQRGHRIYAYANTAPICEEHPRLQVKTAQHRVPANSLANWEHSWRADQWQKELGRTTTFDLVWRMHPYSWGCPRPPLTNGKPLVVGPLFYGWPDQPATQNPLARPRFGIGIEGLVKPAALRGWQRTLSQAALILCATDNHTAAVQEEYPRSRVQTLPVIVDTPDDAGRGLRASYSASRPLRLLFIANLLPYKQPLVFCEAIQRLRAYGIPAEGVLLGDGPERAKVEAYCAEHGLKSAVCFRGKVANAEVFEHLRESHFLVSTSLGEPYGRGIAEAMAVGIPAVCHRSGGPADFIADGGDGLLVEELTPKAYADRIAEAVNRPGLWQALSENARRKAAAWRSEVVLSHLEESLLDVAARSVRGKTG